MARIPDGYIIMVKAHTQLEGNACVVTLSASEPKELILCMHCKHYNTAGCDDGFGWCERSGDGHPSTDDWYCADGERKDGGDA